MGKRVSRVTMQSQRSANARVHGMTLFVFTFLLYDDVCTQLIYGVARSLLGVAFSVSGTLPSPERIVLEKQNTSAMAPCVVGDLGENMEKRRQQVKTGRRAGPGLGQDKL